MKKLEIEIEIPENIEFSVKNMEVSVKGPKGELKRDFSSPIYDTMMKISTTNKKIIITPTSDKKKIKSYAHTISKHIRNMITGVSKGYKYIMKTYYSHFPINISVEGNSVVIKNFVGEKGSRKAKIQGNCKVTAKKDTVEVEGINKDDVGQTCANIEQACKLSRKDKRIFNDGIYLTGKFLQNGEKI